jgi:hypothetical protein
VSAHCRFSVSHFDRFTSPMETAGCIAVTRAVKGSGGRRRCVPKPARQIMVATGQHLFRGLRSTLHRFKDSLYVN